MSGIARAIDEVVNLRLAPSLKQDGFIRKGRFFVRQAEQCLQMVGIQASQSNVGKSGKMTVNLGIHFPAVEKLVKGWLIKKPSVHDCTVNTRLGFLLPEFRDKWWEISEHSDLQALSDEIHSAWTGFGKPWIDRNSRLEEALTLETTYPEQRAAMAIILGRPGEAIRALEKGISATRDPTYRRTLAAWAKSHGLSLEG